jgi:hypothetical protein
MTVTETGDNPAAARLRRLRDRGYLSHSDLGEPRQFGQPSSYSLSRAELARHVRQLRRSGWQSWEVAVRFDFWPAA